MVSDRYVSICILHSLSPKSVLRSQHTFIFWFLYQTLRFIKFLNNYTHICKSLIFVPYIYKIQKFLIYSHSSHSMPFCRWLNQIRWMPMFLLKFGGFISLFQRSHKLLYIYHSHFLMVPFAKRAAYCHTQTESPAPPIFEKEPMYLWFDYWKL